jgi:hypothetical protein
MIVVLIGLLSVGLHRANSADQHNNGPLRIPSLEELSSEMARQEARLLNLKVESQMVVQKRGPRGDQWEDTPVGLTCTAWYNGLPGSKVRVDAHKKVVEWLDGLSPFLEESYTAAYDGQYGRVARHSGGALGQPGPYARGQITRELPLDLVDPLTSRATGAAYCTFFHFAAQKTRFSDTLKQAASVKMAEQPKVTSEVILGSNCIRVTGGDPAAAHESFWFDPGRGYALVGHELVDRGKDGALRIAENMRVTRLAEAAPGIWYPVEAYCEYNSTPGSGKRADRRCLYKASKVVANDPGFEESVFAPPFPPGYYITDKIRGTTYRAGLSPTEPGTTRDAP